MGTFARVATVTAVLLALLLAWLVFKAPSTTAQALASGAAGTQAGIFQRLFSNEDQRGAAQIPAFVTGLENLPASLQGTEVDGELEVDAQGHLKITNGVRHVFDYFLSALGEEPLESIVARLHAYFANNLPPAAAAEARGMLADYLAYKQALVALDVPATTGEGLDLDAARARMAQVKALRSRVMSAEMAAAFFGDDDAFDQYSLERMTILQREDLAPAQQAQQLASLEESLPPALQASMKSLNQYRNLEALTSDWQQRAGTPAELRQIRENLLGTEAADRLETLDRDRADWDARMNAWFAERAALLGNNGLSPEDRERQVDALRAQRFAAEELARVQALERIRDGKAG